MAARSTLDIDVIHAGQAIAHHVLQSHIFHQRKWLGIYLHCAKLREVDTTLVVKAALEDGRLPQLTIYKRYCSLTCHIGLKAYATEVACTHSRLKQGVLCTIGGGSEGQHETVAPR